MRPIPQETATLVTLTEEIFNEKLIFCELDILELDILEIIIHGR